MSNQNIITFYRGLLSNKDRQLATFSEFRKELSRLNSDTRESESVFNRVARGILLSTLKSCATFVKVHNEGGVLTLRNRYTGEVIVTLLTVPRIPVNRIDAKPFGVVGMLSGLPRESMSLVFDTIETLAMNIGSMVSSKKLFPERGEVIDDIREIFYLHDEEGFAVKLIFHPRDVAHIDQIADLVNKEMKSLVAG